MKSPSDSDIKNQIEQQISWDNQVSTQDVRVTVSNGQVTLDGTVTSLSASYSAALDAWNILGVKTVDNNLKIRFLTQTSAPTDREILEAVESILKWSQSLNRDDLSIDVHSGTVTLSGTVDAFWKKIRAETLVSEVSGVTRIINEIVVIPSHLPQDNAIAEQIIDALKRRPNINIDEIDIQVNKGKVNLAGHVSNYSDWEAVFATVQNTTGVVDIIDNVRLK